MNNPEYGPLVIIMKYLSIYDIIGKINRVSKTFFNVSKFTFKNRMEPFNFNRYKLKNKREINDLIFINAINVNKLPLKKIVINIVLNKNILPKILEYRSDEEIEKVLHHLKFRYNDNWIIRRNFNLIIEGKLKLIISFLFSYCCNKSFRNNLFLLIEKINKNYLFEVEKLILNGEIDLIYQYFRRRKKIINFNDFCLKLVDLHYKYNEFSLYYSDIRIKKIKKVLKYLIKKKLKNKFIYRDLIDYIVLKRDYKLLNLINFERKKIYIDFCNRIIEKRDVLNNLKFSSFKRIDLCCHLISQIKDEKLAIKYIKKNIFNRKIQFYIGFIIKIINFDFVKKASEDLKNIIFNYEYNKITFYTHIERIYKSYSNDYDIKKWRIFMN
jgi:hypothetical protein